MTNSSSLQTNSTQSFNHWAPQSGTTFDPHQAKTEPTDNRSKKPAPSPADRPKSPNLIKLALDCRAELRHAKPTSANRLPDGAKNAFMRAAASDHRDFKRAQPLNSLLGHALKILSSTALGAFIGLAAGGPIGAAIGAGAGAYLGIISSAIRYFGAKGETERTALINDESPLPKLENRIEQLEHKAIHSANTANAHTPSSEHFADKKSLELATESMEIKQAINRRLAYLEGKARVIDSAYTTSALPLKNTQTRLARVAIAWHIGTLDDYSAKVRLDQLKHETAMEKAQAQSILLRVSQIEQRHLINENASH